MTTASTGTRPATVASGVRGAALLALLVGAGCVVTAVVVADRAAAIGALTGSVLVVGTFAFGAGTVNAVAARLPAAALLVAVLTYTLEVVLLAVVFVVLRDSGATDGDVDPKWLGLTAIAVTFAWIVGQIVGTIRSRQPVYDLKPARETPADPDRGGDQRP